MARDPATGEMGVAVHSHWFSVGSIVSWAAPGAGAVDLAAAFWQPPALDPLHPPDGR